eukprot:CAMPEP_0196825550 /NCGR_PEP_ID=MMETSP1362-20130617/93119_1 /TAXON_ID=163516 /ORGANISM="Leptocylindrus danicus, Strain CCMP1856" /LENGTH=63 /DNA_ID=CAMNT_0042205991 /DNA_START=402 /DNA_END=593 /DNA_ORIENTATION=-
MRSFARSVKPACSPRLKKTTLCMKYMPSKSTFHHGLDSPPVLVCTIFNGSYLFPSIPFAASEV